MRCVLIVLIALIMLISLIGCTLSGNENRLIDLPPTTIIASSDCAVINNTLARNNCCSDKGVGSYFNMSVGLCR